MGIEKVVIGLVVWACVPFAIACAESLPNPGAAPVSALMAEFAAAVGPDGTVDKVDAHGPSVLFQGYARDPTAVLGSLSSSSLIDRPQLIPVAHDPTAGLQLFVVGATLSAPIGQRAGGGLDSAKPEDELFGHVRRGLDSHMAARCQSISAKRVSDDAADAETVSMAMRWRCPGALPQLMLALRDLELGAPGVTLSDYAFYLQSPKPAVAANTYVELRFTATATTLAAR